MDQTRRLPPATDAIVSLLWSSTDLVVITRLSDGVLTHANDAVFELTGIPPERFIGRTSLEIGLWADPGDRATFLSTLHEQGQIDGVPVSMRDANGELHVTHVSAKLATVDGEMVLISIARDATEACRTEELLAIEHAVARRLSRSQTLAEAAPRVLALIGERIDWDVGLWWAVDDRAGLLRHLSSWRSPLAEVPELTRTAPWTTFRIGEGLPGWVWELGTPIWVPEVHGNEQMVRMREANADAVHSAALFPVVADRHVLGVVEFFSRKNRQADDALLETFEALGSQLGQFARGR
jgi:two-component system, cell cycle sensor histidine kinase and response regulator CckA